MTAVEEALRIRPTWHNGGAGDAGTDGLGGRRDAGGRRRACAATCCASARSGRRRTRRAARRPRPVGAAAAGGSAATCSGGCRTARRRRRTGSRCTRRTTSTATARPGRRSAGSRSTPVATRRSNPTAVYRDPLTMDDYLSARMVIDAVRPLRLRRALRRRGRRDRVGGGRRARTCRSRPVHVDAVGTQITERISWDQGTMTHEPQVLGPAAHLWTRTALTPRRRRRGPAVRRLHLQLPDAGWRRSGSAGSARRRRLPRRRARASPSTASCRSTPTAASCPPAAPTATASSTRRSCSCAATPASVRCADAEVAVVASGGGVPGGCLLLIS